MKSIVLEGNPLALMTFRRLLTNGAVFLAFTGLTIMMTWPWARSLRDFTPDTGDSYLNAWILWWDYHQTFRAPLHLFDANIFYPYQYTLAFSEHNYGIALFFFPLYALGFRPLTVHGIAVLTGFAFAGFGAFRLMRTLTKSTAAAWIGGIAFAFVPFRFHHLPHVTYLFSGWIPLLLEALILYTRRHTRSRAAWLGIAFFLNALTCIHWLILTLIPLGVTAILLVSRYARWRDRRFWLYGVSAIAIATVALLPFLLPYIWVKNLYGFQRTAEEATLYSAHLINWLMVDWQNKFWGSMGPTAPYQTELALFPGFIPPLLAIAAFRFLPRENSASAPVYRDILIGLLDAIIVTGVVLALVCIRYGQLQPKILGIQLFHLASPWPALAISALAAIIRLTFSAPAVLNRLRAIRFRLGRPGWLSEALEIGLVWTIVGFIGSFGMNFIFHRFLFEYVSIFRSIRVPARWAMICYVGLSILAGAGALHLITRLGSRAVELSVLVVLIAVLMAEQRSAPLKLVHGAVDPDPVTLRLRELPMRGGVLELPAGVGQANYLYTLRAADHARPLVNGVSGFLPPIQRAIEEMSNGQPVSPRFADLIEAIPVSYVVVHHALLTPASESALAAFFAEGVAAGRFRLVAQFGDHRSGDDLYVVFKTEPHAASE